MRGWRVVLVAVSAALALAACVTIPRIRLDNATGAGVFVHLPIGDGGARRQIELEAGRRQTVDLADLGDVLVLSSGRCYYEYELPWASWKTFVETYGVNRLPIEASIGSDFTIRVFLSRVIAEAPVDGVTPKQIDDFALAPTSKDCR